MNIAFYAPMKPVSSSIPSGDLRMARTLVAALESQGHRVEIASEFVSYQPIPNEFANQDIYVHARELATTLVGSFRAKAAEYRPQVWFTYHLYYKAPDWIGPAVADVLGIPYVVAEASFAPKHAGGPWDLNLRGVEAAIRRADLAFGLNSADTACVQPLLKTPDRLVSLKPFLPSAAKSIKRRKPGAIVELLTVAMMRRGAKLDSYRVLARALARLPKDGWHLTIVGDGQAESEVRALFAMQNISFAGRLTEDQIAELQRSADLFLWPAVGEAYGMAILDAQSAGIPVVAGAAGGVADIVADGETGVLTPEGDAEAFGDAVAALITAPERRRAMGLAAAKKVASEHGFAAAAATIDRHIRALVA